MYDQTEEESYESIDSAVNKKDLKTSCYQLEDENIEQLQNMKCIIGFGILNNPVVDKCGHIYCKGCILQSLQQKKQCPISRDSLTRQDLRPIHQIRNLIDNSNIMCKECNCMFQLKDNKNHKQLCQYFKKYKDQPKEMIKEIFEKKNQQLEKEKVNQRLKEAFNNLWKDTIFYQQIQLYNPQDSFELKEQIFVYQGEYIPDYELMSFKEFMKIFQKMNNILDYLHIQSDIEDENKQEIDFNRLQGIRFCSIDSSYTLYIQTYIKGIQLDWVKQTDQEDQTEDEDEELEQDSQISNQYKTKCQQIYIENLKEIRISINEKDIVLQQTHNTQNLKFEFKTDFKEVPQIYAIVCKKIN